MQIDVEKLRDFYTGPLGHIVRHIIGRKIRKQWRGLNRGTLIGLGFTTPYMSGFRSEVSHLGALMPGHQGAVVWPRHHRVQTALVDDSDLPLADNSVDRLLVVHGLETVGFERQFVRECWRVLSPEGRLLLIVANRRGIWARTDRTPFGFGRPYSRGQLESLLRDSLFTPTSWDTALHMPPLKSRFVQKSAIAWERFGRRVTPAFAGVLMVEARKELSAPTGVRELSPARYETVLQTNRSAVVVENDK